MKKKIFLAILIAGAFTLNTASAQIRFSLNIGAQPVWGPVGYEHAESYYMPDIETYYNVQSRQYTYMENGRWVSNGSLPQRYRNYDLYGGHKVVINESRPWLRHNEYKVKYASYRNRHDQQAIRDSRDRKYYENKDHPRHNEWKQEKRDDHDRKKDEHNRRKG